MTRGWGRALPEGNREMLDATSQELLANPIEIPLLVAAGQDDQVAVYGQSPGALLSEIRHENYE